jgi:hypothetical protein
MILPIIPPCDGLHSKPVQNQFQTALDSEPLRITRIKSI